MHFEFNSNTKFTKSVPSQKIYMFWGKEQNFPTKRIFTYMQQTFRF